MFATKTFKKSNIANSIMKNVYTPQIQNVCNAHFRKDYKSNFKTVSKFKKSKCLHIILYERCTTYNFPTVYNVYCQANKITIYEVLGDIGRCIPERKYCSDLTKWKNDSCHNLCKFMQVDIVADTNILCFQISQIFFTYINGMFL